jgi:outer membrane protein OmpA-like peptidoglycan-associated protein
VFTRPISIAFDSGSSTLDLSALATINRELVPQAEIARQMYLRIEGNTGDEAMNRALSDKRAKAIVDHAESTGDARWRGALAAWPLHTEASRNAGGP